MAHLPDSFIDDLLNRIDLVELIDRHVPLKKAGANYVACCPFHGEKTPSFSVSPHKQFYHCFGCGVSGNAISFLMEYAGQSFIDAVTELASKSGLKMPEFVPNSPENAAQNALKTSQRASLTEIMKTASDFYYEAMKNSPRAVEYLKKRGLSGDTVKAFQIGFAGEDWQNLNKPFKNYEAPELQEAGLVIKNESGRFYDRFRERIMFPIINQKGETIAFGGRILDAGEPKYLNSPETPLFEKGRELFGLPQARSALRATNTAIVVEGYMDVVALYEQGVQNAVATLGTATTPTHIQKLLRQVDRLIFCFDGDKAGQKAAWRALENALELLTEQKFIGFVFLDEKDDPDSFIRQHGKVSFDRLMKEATPLSDFLLQKLASECDLGSAEGCARLIAEAKPRLLRLATPLIRLQLVKRLGQMSGFSQGEVERLCGLKSFAKQAKERAPRKAPSLLAHLLGLLVQKPELATQIPLDLLPESAEGQSIAHFCALVKRALESTETVSFSVLLERIQRSENDTLLADSVSEALTKSLANPFDDAEIDSDFVGILARLHQNTDRNAFLSLQDKVRKLGVTGLSSEEKEAYLAALIKGVSKND